MANVDMNFPLFKGKTFSDLLGDIYENQQSKKKNISGLIEEMRKLVTKASDVITIGPIITQLIEASISNDDHLIKLATIGQRLAAAEAKGIGEDGWLSEHEKLQLLNDLDDTINEIQETAKERMTDIEIEIEEIKTKL